MGKFVGSVANGDAMSDSEDEYVLSESDDGTPGEPPPSAVEKMAATLKTMLTTGVFTRAHPDISTGRRRKSKSGVHGGTTTASRSKRDARNLGIHVSGEPIVLAKRVRAKPNAYIAEPGSGKLHSQKLHPGPAPVSEKAPKPEDSSWETEAPSVPFCTAFVSRSDKERHLKASRRLRKSNVDRAAYRAKKQAEEMLKLIEASNEVFLDFSMRLRRELAVSAFAKAREVGYEKTASWLMAGIAARVSDRTVRSWINDWVTHGDGFFTSCMSGCNRVAGNLDEPDVKEACRQWWHDQAPIKGQIVPENIDLPLACL